MQRRVDEKPSSQPAHADASEAAPKSQGAPAARVEHAPVGRVSPLFEWLPVAPGGSSSCLNCLRLLLCRAAPSGHAISALSLLR
jgi:hypothetical protein